VAAVLAVCCVCCVCYVDCCVGGGGGYPVGGKHIIIIIITIQLNNRRVGKMGCLVVEPSRLQTGKCIFINTIK